MSKVKKEAVKIEELSDEAKIDRAERQQDKEAAAFETARAAAEPEIPEKEMAEIEAAEKETVESKFTTEQLIEKYRVITNNIMILADKVRESNGGKVSQILENKFRDSYNMLHVLLSDYSSENKRDGFKVLIERTGVDAKGFLIIDAGGREEADTMASDIRQAIKDLVDKGKDSLVSVVSGLSDNTRSAEIKASTIGGFAVQRYDIYPEYKEKGELFPLDNIPKNNTGRVNESQLRLVK